MRSLSSRFSGKMGDTGSGSADERHFLLRARSFARRWRHILVTGVALLCAAHVSGLLQGQTTVNSSTSDPAYYFNAGSANSTTWIYGTTSGGVPHLRVQRDGGIVSNYLSLAPGNVNSASPTIALNTSGSSYFNTGGNVGIGTTAPA